MKRKLMFGDCLERMKEIPDSSIDCIIVDPPYGKTNCRWDSVISLKPMWKQIKRIIKENGAICIFGTEPFSSFLRINNIEIFKYDWVWQKDRAVNHLNAKKQPMRRNEIISIFYKKQCLYNPQLIKKEFKNIRPPHKSRKQTEIYGKMDKISKREIPIDMKYPNETLKFSNYTNEKTRFHPSQKPIELLKYLIKTYTLKNETVLDFAMGSGSTGVACKNLKRNSIGIEKDKKYFRIAKQRIKEAKVE